jgi:hypothetical protein
MGIGKTFTFLGGILTLLGTYVFAVYGGAAVVGSGIGFILNLSDLFGEAETNATLLSIPLGLYYVFLTIFIIFLASGILQMLSRRSRAVGFIFSLFPLGVGLMLFLVAYTDILGNKAGFFTIYFASEQFGDFFPILIELGYLDLGAYFLVAGGILGVISVFSERD